MLKNLNIYNRSYDIIHQKISSIRDFSKKIIKKARDFIEYGEFADDITQLELQNIEDSFIDDGFHFKQVELEMLIEGELKSVTLNYEEMDDKTGFTIQDIEDLETDIKKRYNNDFHTGIVRYRLFNSEFSREYTPFVLPVKKIGTLAKYADIEFMINNEVQMVSISADNTLDKKGFTIRDIKSFDKALKEEYGYSINNGVVRFKLYSNLYEYTQANYVYMNVQKVMTHSDLFDYFCQDNTLMNVIIDEAEEDVNFLTFKRWVDMYNDIDAKIPRYAIYENGSSFPLLDNDYVYYYEEPTLNDNITVSSNVYSLTKKPKKPRRTKNKRVAA